MQIHNLKLRNFRQHADSELTFGLGVTGVIGANGAGKSTVLEGISYALYGGDATRGTRAGVRWNQAPARRVAEVELGFSVGGTRYDLHRTENNAILRTPDEIVGSGTSAVNGMIPGILGLSLREFEASYLCSQKDLARIASMGPTERQGFFRSVMGVGRVDEAVQAARAARNDLTRARDGIAVGLGSREPLEAECAAAKSAHIAASVALEAAEAEAAEAVQLAASAVQLLHTADERRLQWERLAGQRNVAERVANEAGRTAPAILHRIGLAELAQARAQAGAAELERLPAARLERDRLLQLRERDREVERLRGERSRLAKETSTREAEIERLRGEVAEADPGALATVRERHRSIVARLVALHEERVSTASATRAELRAAQNAEQAALQSVEQLIELGAEGECPVCTQTLGNHFGAVLEQLTGERQRHAAAEVELSAQLAACQMPGQEELDAAAEKERLNEELADLESAERRAQHAEALLTAAGRTLELLRESMQDVDARLAVVELEPFSAEALAAVEEEIGELEVRRQALEADRALAGELVQLREEYRTWVAKEKEADAALTELTEQIARLAFDFGGHDQIRQDAMLARARREAKSAALARAEAELVAAKERRSRADAALDEYRSREQLLAEASEQLRIHDTAAHRLAEFRTSVASTIRPEMEELVSGFVSLLTDGRFESASLAEDFGVTLYRDGIAMEVVSGGEEDVVALSMRLATAQMIAERAGQPLSLLILDEPFGSQDEVRRANMMALFRRLQGLFPQIVLISHVPEIQNEVDRAVMVEYDQAAGCSRVYELAGIAG